MMVPEYEAKAPIDPSFVVANVPPEVFEMKFANTSQKPQFDHETTLQEINNINPNAGGVLVRCLMITETNIPFQSMIPILRNIHPCFTPI
jgi:hypothetical protein